MSNSNYGSILHHFWHLIVENAATFINLGQGQSRLLKLEPFNSLRTVSYKQPIVTVSEMQE